METKLHNSGQPGYDSCTRWQERDPTRRDTAACALLDADYALVCTASGWRRENVCTQMGAAAWTRSQVMLADLAGGAGTHSQELPRRAGSSASGGYDSSIGGCRSLCGGGTGPSRGQTVAGSAPRWRSSDRAGRSAWLLPHRSKF